MALYTLNYAKTYLLVTYLLITYLLTPWAKVLHEKLPGSQLAKNFPTFYGTKSFIIALKKAHHLSFPEQLYQHFSTKFKAIYYEILITELCIPYLKYTTVSHLPKPHLSKKKRCHPVKVINYITGLTGFLRYTWTLHPCWCLIGIFIKTKLEIWTHFYRCNMSGPTQSAILTLATHFLFKI
jgi:hypothetical protein